MQVGSSLHFGFFVKIQSSRCQGSWKHSGTSYTPSPTCKLCSCSFCCQGTLLPDSHLLEYHKVYALCSFVCACSGTVTYYDYGLLVDEFFSPYESSLHCSMDCRLVSWFDINSYHDELLEQMNPCHGFIFCFLNFLVNRTTGRVSLDYFFHKN